MAWWRCDNSAPRFLSFRQPKFTDTDPKKIVICKSISIFEPPFMDTHYIPSPQHPHITSSFLIQPPSASSPIDPHSHLCFLFYLYFYISTPHPPKVYMETPPPSLNPLPRFPAAPRLLDIITSSAQPPPPTSRPHHAIYFATTPQPQPLQPPT